jgi:hypothetical protein
MNPKILLLLPGLTVYPAQPARAVVRTFRPVVPIHAWPQSRELPEDTEPGHGRGSSESRMFIGATTLNTNTASGQMMIANSEPISNEATHETWLSTGPIILSVGFVESLPQSLPTLTVDSAPNRVLSNPSMIKMRRSVTRRRG